MRVGGDGGTKGFGANDGAAPLGLGEKELLIGREPVDCWLGAFSFARPQVGAIREIDAAEIAERFSGDELAL